MAIDYTAISRTYGTTHANSLTKIGKFEIFMDEPKAFDGEDSAPGPLDFILAAHGGCLNFTTFFVAREMGLNIRKAEIKLKARLDTAKLVGQDVDTRAGYEKIEVTIKLDTDEPQEKLDALCKAVEARCCVSDNICNATPIAVSMSAGL